MNGVPYMANAEGQSPLTLPLSRQGRGNYSVPLGDVPSPLAGEGQGEGENLGENG